MARIFKTKNRRIVMDYEKLYKRALERAKAIIKVADNQDEAIGFANTIFPELKESEDEKIRDEIVLYIGAKDDISLDTHNKWLSWLEKQNSNVDNANKEYWRGYREGKQEILDKYAELEKQGEQKCIPKYKIGDYVKNTNYKGEPIYEIVYMDKECYICEYRGKERMGDKAVMHFSFDNPYLRLVQKPTDKVEPKFKVGDWVVQGCNILKIRCVGGEYYCFETVGGYVDDMLVSEMDSLYRLWTIQDAKPGDVLVCNEEILLFKSYSVQGRISLYCWYNGQTNNFHSKEMNDISLSTRNKIYPATKEQRDTLFAKMREAGFQLPTS